MNTLKQAILSAVITGFAGSAFAFVTLDNSSKAVSTKSRAEVSAEAKQSLADGSTGGFVSSHDFVGPVVSQKTREQVRAEYFAARESGEYDEINREAQHAISPVRRTTGLAKAAGNSMQ